MSIVNVRRTPTLGDLLPAVTGGRLVRGDGALEITGVSHDTRRLREGELFVAIPGFRRNGLDLVPEALARGARAIVAEAIPPGVDSAPLVLVPSARAALADLAAAFHGHPSRRLSVVGITGTDGKTTTAHLLSAILEARGLKTGWLSTVNTKIADRIRRNATEHTTPEAPVLQSALLEMAAAGVDVAILETSSHALELGRVRSTAFKVGVFTNLSAEHINFHGTFEAYRAAKGRLFAAVPPDGLAVLNADDPSSGFMRSATRAPVMTYALEGPADLRAADIVVSPGETRFTVHLAPSVASNGADGRVSVNLRTSLVGRFNVLNWLAAYCAATYFGATPDDLRQATERQPPVLGRMNLVRQGQPFLVVVDFAHTPRALEHALETLRRIIPGRILLIFGLPGGRDSRNRRAMGQLAAEKSDFFAVTMDDPYDEDPIQIARHIAEGAAAAGAVEGGGFIVDLDRRSALRAVLRRARAGDVVLLAGHGHLDQLVIGPRKFPWSDADVVAEELRALGYHTPA
jgi:UDP-N-acetylmuramoyl-L-alanyl-D-glutamate--2,6-diaminopimelate ligase